MGKLFYIFVATVALAQFIHCENEYEVTETAPPEPTTSSPFTCEKEGKFCKDCNTLVQCIEGEEGWEEFPVSECDTKNGEYCYRDRECNKIFNPECITDYTFKCTAQGMFPDPVICSKYHICVHNSLYVDSTDHPNDCKKGYGYNMSTTYCDIKLPNNGTCPDSPPVPICKTLGQTGPLTNKSIWYICRRTETSHALYPELHLCANGKWYDGNSCVEHKYL